MRISNHTNLSNTVVSDINMSMYCWGTSEQQGIVNRSLIEQKSNFIIAGIGNGKQPADGEKRKLMPLGENSSITSSSVVAGSTCTQLEQQVLIGCGSNFYYALGTQPLGSKHLERKQKVSSSSDDRNCHIDSIKVESVTSKPSIAKASGSTIFRYSSSLAMDMDLPFWKSGAGVTTMTTSTAIGDPNSNEVNNENESNDRILQQVACSSQATIFLTKAGNIYQQGTMHGVLFPSPELVQIPDLFKVIHIAAGRHFAIALLEQNRGVISWGANQFGQLGIGIVPSSSKNDYVTRPVVIERLLPQNTPDGTPIVSIAAGHRHALALTASGRVLSWGWNMHLQCGLDNCNRASQTPPESHDNGEGCPDFTKHSILCPEQVMLPVRISKISAGQSHTVSVSFDRKNVYCWGSNRYGQCGVRITNNPLGNKPALVKQLDANVFISQVATGGNHTLVLTDCGKVIAWGNHVEGQLGIVNGFSLGIMPQAKPRTVNDFGVSIRYESGFVDSRNSRSEATSPTSSLFNITESTSMKRNQQYSENLTPRIVSIAAGDTYSTAVCSSGQLYVWGSNDVGQIGLAVPSESGEDLPYVRDGSKIPHLKGSKDNVVNTGHTNTHPRKKSSSRKPARQVRLFDSNHNVLLPERVDFVDDIRVKQIACGPNHMWIFGEPKYTLRASKNQKDQVEDQGLQEVVLGRKSEEERKHDHMHDIKMAANKNNNRNGYQRLFSSRVMSCSDSDVPQSLRLFHYLPSNDDDDDCDDENDNIRNLHGGRFSMPKQNLLRRRMSCDINYDRNDQ